MQIRLFTDDTAIYSKSCKNWFLTGLNKALQQKMKNLVGEGLSSGGLYGYNHLSSMEKKTIIISNFVDFPVYPHRSHDEFITQYWTGDRQAGGPLLAIAVSAGLPLQGQSRYLCQLPVLLILHLSHSLSQGNGKDNSSWKEEENDQMVI